MLGRACPEEISDGRQTICAAGFSPKYGFIRIYPTRHDSPLKMWNIVKVPVEKPLKPIYDGRKESWKIIGSRSDWDRLSEKIEVVGELSRKDRPHLIRSLVSGCVSSIYDGEKSLGIIKPTEYECYFEDQKPKPYTQTTIDQSFRVKVREDYPIIPRIRYRCTDCKTKSQHDQQIISWEMFEWFRKEPEKQEQVWDNLQMNNPDYEKYFFVGNLYKYPKAYVIISVIRFKK